MKRVFLLLFVFILCAPNLVAQQKDHYTIDLSGKEKKAEIVNLSSIASDIDYIPLEITKESYITGVFRLIKTSENLLVLDYNNMKYTRLLIFDLDGSFIKLIQSEGKGPGEYVSISDFTYDPVNKLIVILDSYQKKVLHFSLSGEFVKEYAIDVYTQNISFIEPNHICMLIPLSRVKPDNDGKLYNLLVYDLELNLIKRIPSTMENTYPEMGRFKMPASIYSSIEKRRKESKKYKEISGFIETQNQFFMKYHYQNKPYVLLQNKNGGELVNLSGKWDNYGLINDFDGSMKFWPKQSTAPDELVTYYNAIDLLEKCEKHNVRKFKSKFPDQKKKFLRVLDQIDEESNPVIQMVKLK